MRLINKALLAGGALFIVLVVAFLLYRRMGPLPTLTDRDIAGATAITSQWLEIGPAPALKPSGKQSLVILELEGDYTPDFQAQMLRFPDGTLGMPDVQLVDQQGNVYSTGPGGLWIFSPEGKPLGTILLSENAANCAWAGPDRKTLYITASSSIYRIHLNIAGAPLTKSR